MILLPSHLLQLEVCAGKREEDFTPSSTMIATAATKPFPELHQEFTELQFFTNLRDLMTTAGYASFSWRDLHCPTTKRLRYQLSAIINLAKYREEQLRVYAELNEPVRFHWLRHCVVCVPVLAPFHTKVHLLS
jgi:Nuf2 family